MKRQNGIVRFQIATKENGYITELDRDLEALILDLADKVVDRTYPEGALVPGPEKSPKACPRKVDCGFVVRQAKNKKLEPV